MDVKLRVASKTIIVNGRKTKRKNQQSEEGKQKGGNQPYRVHIRKGTIAPDELRVTLRYTQRVPLASVVGVPASQLFTGNGPFDPDNTGTGLQPEGYDEWSTLYSRQRTVGSRCRLKGINTTQTLAFEELVLCPVPTTISVITDINNLKAAKYAQTVLVATNTKAEEINIDMDTAKLMGLPKIGPEVEENYQSLVTANPSRLWLWQIAMQPVDQTSTTTLVVYVEVDYDIVFFSRRALALS